MLGTSPGYTEHRMKCSDMWAYWDSSSEAEAAGGMFRPCRSVHRNGEQLFVRFWTKWQAIFLNFPRSCAPEKSVFSLKTVTSFPCQIHMLMSWPLGPQEVTVLEDKTCTGVAVVQLLSSVWPHALQHARLSCPSLSPGVCSNSCPQK